MIFNKLFKKPKTKPNTTVVYTAIFGGIDKLLRPRVRPNNIDFVCFSDSDIKSRYWDVRKVEPTHSDPVRSAKIYKILPHKYLSNYETSIYIDGNMIIRGDVNDLLDKYLQSANLAAFNHRNSPDSWDCVYKEAEVLIHLTNKGNYKDDPKIIQKQVDRYRVDGYPEHNGQITGMVLLRHHNEPDVIKVMDDWWSEIEKGSRRDQLSFNYVAWKNKFQFNFIEGNSWNNKYFKRKIHHRY